MRSTRRCPGFLDGATDWARLAGRVDAATLADMAAKRLHLSKAPRPAPVRPPTVTSGAARRRGARLVAGVDEAGRGPLAGPVVVAAVVFEHGRFPDGLDDSKRLTAAERERLYELILAARRCRS